MNRSWKLNARCNESKMCGSSLNDCYYDQPQSNTFVRKDIFLIYVFD
jgi:hypothetical protein